MSFRRHLLNHWLRQVEKPMLARGRSPENLRRAFEIKARLFFHAPSGVRRVRRHLAAADRHIAALHVLPRGTRPQKVVLYFHGGGFVFGSPETHAALVAQIAQRVGAEGILPRYRLAPEHPFPAAVDDARGAWEALIASGYHAGNIIVGGDSAGGALAFGLLAALCAEGRPRPAGVFGFSPLADMDEHGPSFVANSHRDAVLPAQRARDMRQMYLGNQRGDDPRASPARADFVGASPVWLTVADTEILRDDARALAAALQRAGADVQFSERHDLPHVWPILHNVLPEARETLDDLARWVRRLPGWAVES
jgi:epsilon-lactone hydrolase